MLGPLQVISHLTIAWWDLQVRDTNIQTLQGWVGRASPPPCPPKQPFSSTLILCSFPADFSPFTQEGAGAHVSVLWAWRIGCRERQKSDLMCFR